MPRTKKHLKFRAEYLPRLDEIQLTLLEWPDAGYNWIFPSGSGLNLHAQGSYLDVKYLYSTFFVPARWSGRAKDLVAVVSTPDYARIKKVVEEYNEHYSKISKEEQNEDP